MLEDAHAPRQLRYQLQHGPFRAKDLVSTALLHQCYAPMTNKFAAA